MECFLLFSLVNGTILKCEMPTKEDWESPKSSVVKLRKFSNPNERVFGPHSTDWFPKKDISLTEQEALDYFEFLRKKKIASLEKQLKKLKDLKPKIKTT